MKVTQPGLHLYLVFRCSANTYCQLHPINLCLGQAISCISSCLVFFISITFWMRMSSPEWVKVLFDFYSIITTSPVRKWLLSCVKLTLASLCTLLNGKLVIFQGTLQKIHSPFSKKLSLWLIQLSSNNKAHWVYIRMTFPFLCCILLKVLQGGGCILYVTPRE